MCKDCNTSADCVLIVSSNIILAYSQRDCNLNSLIIEVFTKISLFYIGKLLAYPERSKVVMLSLSKRCFEISTPLKRDIGFQNVWDSPFRIYGLHDSTSNNFYRLSPRFAESMDDSFAARMKETAGIRVRFSTNSPFIAVKAELGEEPSAPDVPLACRGFDLYVEKNRIFYFHNSFCPQDKLENKIERITYFADDRLRDILIDFPIGASVKSLKIGIQKGSDLFEGHDYKWKLPVVFYGSSVTQGFFASRPGNTYPNFISRALNCDYINMGFSSCPFGNESIARFLANIQMSAIVIGYDYDAPNAEELEKTHCRLYRIIREQNPSLPVILLSPPYDSEIKEERKCQKAIIGTYSYGILNGDENLYYIDGCSFFKKDTLFDCTVDGHHPNDLGMYFIAKKISKMLNRILKTSLVDTLSFSEES